MVKNPPACAGDIRDLGSVPGSGRSPGGGHGNPLQYTCLENSMNRGAGGLQSIASQESNATEMTYREHTCTFSILDIIFLSNYLCFSILSQIPRR